MATRDNIQQYQAADIERYHQGLLSPQERHALEKAALEDPFLADALEGYAMPGLQAQADLAELRKKLSDRMASTQGAAIPITRRSWAPLLRVAAILIVMVGAGLLVYQFAFTKKDTELAQGPTGTTEPVTVRSDSSAPQQMIDEKSPVVVSDNKKAAAPVTRTAEVTAPAKGEVKNPPADVVSTETVSAPPASASTGPLPASGGAAPSSKPVSQGRKADNQLSDDREAGLAKEESKTRALAKKQESDQLAKSRSANAAQKEQKDLAVENNNGVNNDLYRNQAMNTFRGRVTDGSNTGLPFANVINLRDNVGTYTDANGYFTLTSPDSVLDVQIRSLGFDQNNTQLRNNLASNRIVMQEDRKSLSEQVISSQKPNATARAKEPERTLIEPEPVDGWVKYDSYLANNLNIPDDFIPQKNTSENSVQVSFEVDKNGEPVNIRVEKSLCNTCDKEAVRLIREGPKFKRMAKKKGRTTVTINF